MQSRLLKAYRSLPGPLKSLAKSTVAWIPMRLRMGRGFHRQWACLEASQWWSRDRLEDYQNRQLRALIAHAYQTVPYYRRLFDALGLKPESIRTARDLERLPILRKETVRERTEEFLASDVPPDRRVHIATSGTTGKILTVWAHADYEFMFGGPFEWRFYGWGGYRPGDRCAVLRARFLAPSHGRVFTFNPVQNKLFFSIYDLTAKRVREYVDALRRYQPRFFNCYPSILADLIHLIREAGIDSPVRPCAIFTIAEFLSPGRRALIEGFFDCPVFDWYGMEERAALAHDCEHRTGQHLIPEFGVTELIPVEDYPEPGACRVVATGFNNPAMPLIRYDTEDLAAALPGDCPCGRNFSRIRLLGGRTRQSIVDRDGIAIPVISGPIEHFAHHFRQYQYLQEAPGRVVVRVVEGPGCTPEDLKVFTRNLEMIFHGRVDFRVEPVASIPRTAGGKTPYVIDLTKGNKDTNRADRGF